MSPDASWVKWIVIGAAIVQTIAAVMALRRVRRAHVGLSPNERVRARQVPVSIKVGFVAVVLNVGLWIMSAVIDSNGGRDEIVEGSVSIVAFTGGLALLGNPIGMFDTRDTLADVLARFLSALVGLAVIFTALHFGGNIDLQQVMSNIRTSR